MTRPFADHFSTVAAGYASHRPHYPPALFEYLSALPAARQIAWDCAAGSGQATLALATHFARVIATDASEAQLRSAPAHPQVEYRVAAAEASGLADASIDLIAVAQAVHWFDFDRFYAEVRRVAKPRAIVAVWSYGRNQIDGARIDDAVERFYDDVVGPFWPRERQYIEEGYRTIPFPFAELMPPACEMVAEWTLPQFAGYLRTWSSTTRYREAKGVDPVVALEAELGAMWGPPETVRPVRWPLAIRVGRVG